MFNLKKSILKKNHFYIFKFSFLSFSQKRLKKSELVVDPFKSFPEKKISGLNLKIDNQVFSKQFKSIEITNEKDTYDDDLTKQIFETEIVDENFLTLTPKENLKFEEDSAMNLQILIKGKNAKVEQLILELNYCQSNLIFNLRKNSVRHLGLKFNSSSVYFFLNNSVPEIELNLSHNSDLTSNKLINFKNFKIQTDNSSSLFDKLEASSVDSSLKIKSLNSNTKIQNLVKCKKFEFSGSHVTDTRSLISIENFESDSFMIKLADRDEISLNVNQLSDNSYLKFGKQDINIKIHPILMCAINVYQTFIEKFMAFMFFDREGYTFCPTIVVEAEKELKKGNLIGWEMIKFTKNKVFKVFFGLILAYLVVLTISIKHLNLYKHYSDLKHHQLFFRKVLNDYIKE